MEIKTCLDSNQKDHFPGRDQRGGDFGVRAIQFFHDPVETAGIRENELAQAGFRERSLQIHRQKRTLSDTTLRRRLRFPTLESVTRNRCLHARAITLFTWQHFWLFFYWEKIADFGLNGSLTHRALPALRQFADNLTRFLLPGQASFGDGFQCFSGKISRVLQSTAP